MKNFFLFLLCSLFLANTPLWAGGFVMAGCKDCYWYPNDRPSAYGEPFPEDYDPFFIDLMSENAVVTIADKQAKVEITQTFYNPSSDTIAAYYLFPSPNGQPLSNFTVMVGEDKYRAEKYTPAQSLVVFQELVKRTKKPDYWQYTNGETYRIMLYKTLPRQSVKIVVSYTQDLTEKDNVYTYRYPLNSQRFYKRPIKDTQVSIDVTASQSISNFLPLTSLSLAPQVKDNTLKVVYSGKSAANKASDDVAFSYQVGEPPQTEGLSLLTYKKDGEDGYFMLTFDGGKKAGVNRDVLFVVDISAGIGTDLAREKKAISTCLGKLTGNDRFNILAYNDVTSTAFPDWQTANSTNVSTALGFLNGLSASGGCNVEAALKGVMAIGPDKIRPFQVVLFNGGKPTAGLEDGEDLADLVTKANIKTLRIYPVGMGKNTDVTLLDQIAAASLGYSTYVLPEEDADAIVGATFVRLGSVVLTNLQLYFSGAFEIKDQFPRKPDVIFGDAPFVMIGRYKRPGEYDISLIGDYNDQMNRFNLRGKFPDEDERFPFVAKLWATRMVGYHCNDVRLNGTDPDIYEDMADLADEFMLTTPYTNGLIKKNQGYLSEEEKALLPAFFNTSMQLYGDHLPYLEKLNGPDAVTANREVYALLNVSQVAQLYNPTNSKSATPINMADHFKTLTNGRRLYKTNSGLWADFEVLEKLKAPAKRVAFYSPEYYSLLSQNPALAADFLWTSRDKLTFLANGTRYEIYEDKALLKPKEKPKPNDK